jgi:hypothetical protein
MTLLPCRACGRHVKTEECRCPFCGAARSCDEKPTRVEPTGRRLKAIAMSAAVGLSACGTSQPHYGGFEPPPDAGTDAPADSTTDSPMGGQLLYGGVAPPDAGSETG